MTFIATGSLPETLTYSISVSVCLSLCLSVSQFQLSQADTVNRCRCDNTEMLNVFHMEQNAATLHTCTAVHCTGKRFLIAADTRTHTHLRQIFFFAHTVEMKSMFYTLTPVGLIFICKHFSVNTLFGFLIAFCRVHSRQCVKVTTKLIV